MGTLNKSEIKQVYEKLKNYEEHPRGNFDNAKRFYLEFSFLTDVRSPSRLWPNSENKAGRTLKFLNELIHHFNISTISELEKYAFASCAYRFIPDIESDEERNTQESFFIQQLDMLGTQANKSEYESLIEEFKDANIDTDLINLVINHKDNIHHGLIL